MTEITLNTPISPDEWALRSKPPGLSQYDNDFVEAILCQIRTHPHFRSLTPIIFLWDESDDVYDRPAGGPPLLTCVELAVSHDIYVRLYCSMLPWRIWGVRQAGRRAKRVALTNWEQGMKQRLGENEILMSPQEAAKWALQKAALSLQAPRGASWRRWFSKQRPR